MTVTTVRALLIKIIKNMPVFVINCDLGLDWWWSRTLPLRCNFKTGIRLFVKIRVRGGGRRETSCKSMIDVIYERSMVDFYPSPPPIITKSQPLYIIVMYTPSKIKLS